MSQHIVMAISWTQYWTNAIDDKFMLTKPMNRPTNKLYTYLLYLRSLYRWKQTETSFWLHGKFALPGRLLIKTYTCLSQGQQPFLHFSPAFLFGSDLTSPPMVVSYFTDFSWGNRKQVSWSLNDVTFHPLIFIIWHHGSCAL